ncbi:type IV secretory system conjugative DNA transfer family protein [Spiroplasma ixodetis]|uniref:AAA+ ATPase domain-containing protein n=1 Tax=Spiroplasma ixodetis TaxID=2141 RepID=A0ABN6T1B4_9MOLU|nr:type IV secretion system DNA-binding domain-containing protein [Spiroplasma ixodetis]BDT05203.1 hypothetical protein SHM_28490 [Spiroplasma ixodetis]
MIINWIKNKWQENIFHKIWIFAMIWSLIFLALWMSVAFIGAILYAWYYYPSVNFKNWFASIFESWVTETSFGVSFLIFMGCLFYYFYINFEKWNPKNSKLKNEIKIQEKEFKKLGSTNLINLNKKVGLVKSKLNQHTLLIGATGSGKTTTALSIINQLVYKLNQTVIIIDGKGDSDLINKVKSIDNNAFIWTINGDNQYNPFASKSHIILADKIMSLFDFTEPHYQAIAHSYLLILLETLVSNKIEMTLSNIIKYFSKENLINLIDSNDQNYDYLTTFKNDDIQGLENRLNVYNEQLNQSIGLKNDFSSIVKNHKVILFSLNSLDYPQLASNIGKLLIQDLKEFASIKPGNQHINIILDEFNVFASDSIINLINKTRSFNYQCFLCFQTINDLKTDNKDLTDTIFGNTANIIAHNVKDPNSAEYLAKVFGTKTSQKITKQYDTKNKKSSKGSIREVEEYIVHPNDLKKLKVGQAYCKIILENSIHFIDKITIEKD